MEIVVNRIKYQLPEEESLRLIVSPNNSLSFGMKLCYFNNRFQGEDLDAVGVWMSENNIDNNSYISYGFSKNNEGEYLNLPYNHKFEYNFIIWLLSTHFKSLGFYVHIKPTGIDLSCYELVEPFNNEWDTHKRWDLKFNNNYKELTFNIGSSSTYISRYEIRLEEEIGNLSCVLENGEIQRSKFAELSKSKVIANQTLKQRCGLVSPPNPIRYIDRYKELRQFYNEKLKPSKGISFQSVGFDSIKADKVEFSKNKMLFRDDKTDINPISGMRNYGVYQDAPNALEKQFIFIYQNNDDANTLYKYLKNGYKGFPGLQPYVNIPLTLANSVESGNYKRLEYLDINNLIEKYKNFEQNELPDEYYPNLFAIAIGPFNKDEPCKEYYDLKLALIKKGIPSQFVNYKNIRNSSVFNYHLPNIAIGIHAKMGGVPWRLDSPKKQDLVIGFNQIKSGDKRFIGSTVFFDNQGRLKKTHSFGEKDSSNEVVTLLKRAIEDYLAQETDVQRLIIHYYKSLSQKEQGNIERTLREELSLSIPYAVVEVNDTKSRLELGFDPGFNYKMPVSGSFVRLTPKEYLLFNNNRFKAVAPVGVK
ncbi:MAG: Piwi domain-containing protein, partial [Tunicatimonas sp.]